MNESTTHNSRARSAELKASWPLALFQITESTRENDDTCSSILWCRNTRSFDEYCIACVNYLDFLPPGPVHYRTRPHVLRPGLDIQHLGGTCSSCWMIFSHRVHDIKTRRTVCDPRPTYFSGSPYPRGGRVDFLLKKVKRVFNVLKKTFWVRKSLIWRSANLERLGRITLNVTLCGRVCTIEVEWARLNCSRRLEWNEGSAREPALRFEIHATNINKICTSRELGPHELVAVAFPRCYSWSLSPNAITSPFSRKKS